MDYQWYPGHMTRAKRMMQEDIRLIDLIVELVDARIPLSSRNPDIDQLARGKARVVILNKADLADDQANLQWENYFAGSGCYAARVDSRTRSQLRSVTAQIDAACKAKKERDRKRGILNRPVRAMIVGIPNVGKSTFINSYAGKACVKTGNRPGVTRGKQWIRLNRDVELLDTPGILWPKFENQEIGVRLAVTGAIRDEILPAEDMAFWLIRFLNQYYPQALPQRYGVSGRADGVSSSVIPFAADYSGPQDSAYLCEIARARGCLEKGGAPDLSRAAKLLLDDFRSGRLGRITLDRMPDAEPREALLSGF